MKKLFFLILALPLLLAACKSGGGFETCWANDWTLCYSKNVRLESKNPPTFIMSGKAEPHYLLRRQSDISNAKEFIVRYRVEVIEGNPTLRAKDCDTVRPAQISAFFQRAGDNMFAKGNYQYFRWWSRNRPTLVPGEHTLKVSLDAAQNQWGSVYSGSSKDFPDMFEKAKQNVRQIGVTFGGCKGAGHGILVDNGKMKITILEVNVK